MRKKIKIDEKNQTMTINFSGIRPEIFSKLDRPDQVRYVLSKFNLHPQGRSIPEVREIRESLSKKAVVPSKIDQTVFEREKNYYLNLFNQSFRIGNQKPDERSRYFGIEIECFIPFEVFDIDPVENNNESEMITCWTCNGSGQVDYVHRDTEHRVELDCPVCDGSGEIENEDYDSNAGNHDEEMTRSLGNFFREKQIRGVNIKQDGSLSSDNDGLWPVEITILVRQDDLSNLEKLCKALETLKAEVNKTCGLHVHIDARDFSKSEAMVRGNHLASYLKFLKLMVPATRRENRYCKLQASCSDRYSAINICAYEKQKTIEVRLHSSTTNFKKISNWIRILKTLWDLNQPSGHSRSFQNFLKKFPEELQAYIILRARMFSTLNLDGESEGDCEDDQLDLGA